MTRRHLTADPLWYKDAVFYELHVKSYSDGNADGIGDFKGLTTRLDHLERLGIDCLWLLPMYPSPFRDDGYDISDYRSIHPSYGTLEDFRRFLDAAHDRGLRVITELVINHTSDQHPWFAAARSSRDHPRRDWYVWSDTDDRYAGARIIFLDTERSNWAWDPVSKDGFRAGPAPPPEPLFDPRALAGTWRAGGNSFADLVGAATGNYVADAGIAWGETLRLGEDGTYASDFASVSGGRVLRVHETGRYALRDDLLTFTAARNSEDARPRTYRVDGLRDTADGKGRVLALSVDGTVPVPFTARSTAPFSAGWYRRQAE